MNILFLDAYFAPEKIAFSHLEYDLLDKLVEKGNEITIICPTPTRGITREEADKYKKIKREELYNGKVHVIRFSAPREKRNPVIRALRYFWCNLRTYQIGITRKKTDVVFANSTPPTQGWIAGKVARKLKAPFVYSLQDVFPDSLAVTGLTAEGSLLWEAGRVLEDKTYKGSDRIIVITQTIKENLIIKGVDERKIQYINNWIDADVIRPISKEQNRLFDEIGVDRNIFVVLYAGNFGEAQGAEIVLDAAERLLDNKEIQFVIFGGGPGYADAAKRAGKMSNVIIHPLMPQDRVAEVYSMGDVAIITGKKGVGRSGLPSKTWSIMACNTEIIASFDLDSDLCSIIRENNAGISVEPENEQELVNAIQAAFEEKAKEHDLRAVVRKIADKNTCTTAYWKVIENVVSR